MQCKRWPPSPVVRLSRWVCRCCRRHTIRPYRLGLRATTLLHRCVLNCTFSGTFSAQRSFRSIRLSRYLSSHAGAWQVKPDLKKRVPRMHCRSLCLPPEDHIPYQAWTSISRSSLVLLRNSTLALANRASPMQTTMPSSRTRTRSDRSWREINRRGHNNWAIASSSRVPRSQAVLVHTC